MTINCPRCCSERVKSKNYATKAGTAIGCMAGAASIGARIWSGAEIGGIAGMSLGPGGAALGSIAGAVIASLIGAATGGAIGARLGEVIDLNVIDNLRCLECGHDFSEKSIKPEQHQPEFN